MDPREATLLLAPEDGEEIVIVSNRKLDEVLWRLDELGKKAREFEVCKKLHPETVGVKHGKAYALRTPAEPRPSGGKPGARPGHAPHLRPRPDHIDRRIPLRLERRPDCHGRRLSAVQETHTRLVKDLPEPRVDATEYTIERRYCRDCHRLVESPVPGVLPGAQLGVRAMHAIVQMRVQHRLTVEQTPPLLESLYGLKVNEGELHSVLAQMAEACTPVCEPSRESGGVSQPFPPFSS
jgi:hypothetical protein